MARRKPKGWVREPVRHGLAAKGIKTGRVKGVTMAQIRSGYARNKYGLDTSSGSRYHILRQMGHSDEDAQAIIFGIGREEGEPGPGVPMMREHDQPSKSWHSDIMVSLGVLSEKALSEGRMNMMTGPRIVEAARNVEKGDYDYAIGMLKEVAGLGPAEVTRRANLITKDIQHLKEMKAKGVR